MFVGREDIGVELPHGGCQFQGTFQLYLRIQESQEKGMVGRLDDRPQDKLDPWLTVGAHSVRPHSIHPD